MFTNDFKAQPYWWENWNPTSDRSVQSDIPQETEVLVIGAGYAGLSCALELASNGVAVTVLDALAPGMGASTRNGGQVTGGVNVGKVPSGSAGSETWQKRQVALLTEAAQAYKHFESVLSRHQIECGYHKNGRITAAWTPEHVESWRARLKQLNDLTNAQAYVMTDQEMREELATTIYSGGIFIRNAGYIDPALYCKGLLDAAVRAGAKVCGDTAVSGVERKGTTFVVRTSRGDVIARDVVVTTNGHTTNALSELHKLVVPVTSHQIATEELPSGLARTLIPKRRAVAETRRVVNYYRMSSDGKRLLFGGRARFYPMNERQSAHVLRMQLVQRFPQMADVKISHSWSGRVALTFDFLPHIGKHEGIHYALGCNGSGVTMMSHLGHRVARMLIEARGPETSAYGTPAPKHVLYHGKPWFMPVLGSYYQALDAMDLRKAQAQARAEG